MHTEFSTQLGTVLNIIPEVIAVAVSGGADSFALLHMTQDWAQKNNARVIAFTVDHQLRPESAGEAKDVAAWCTENKIEHHTLHWLGEKPDSGLQAKARNARRQLLCQACKLRGIDYLLLGHQADDQAETMVMRMQRGTGLKGLKAMQPLTRDKSTRVAIIRPLLTMRRMALRQYCMDNALPFIDDPSNEKTEFERIRVRNTLNTLPDLAAGMAKTALRLSRADDTLKQLAQIWFDSHAQFPELGRLWMEQESFNANLPEIRIRILAIALDAIGFDGVQLPALEYLADEMANIEFSGLTLAGAWVRPKVMGKQMGFLFQTAPPRNS